MLGKPEWFHRRKYGGWGLTPKTKEGWIYIVAAITLYVLLLSFVTHELQKIAVSAIFFLFLFADIFHILSQINISKKEALLAYRAERNAIWAIIVILIFSLFIDAYLTVDDGGVYLNPFVLAALIVGAVVKSYTYWRHRNEHH